MSGAKKRARGVSGQEAAGTADGDTAAVLKACHRTAVQELIVKMLTSGDSEKSMIMFHNAVTWVNKTAEGLFHASKLKEGSPYVNIPKGRIISYYIELIQRFPTHKDALEGIRKTVEMRATIVVQSSDVAGAERPSGPLMLCLRMGDLCLNLLFNAPHQPGPGLEDIKAVVKHGVKEYGQSLVHNPAFINQVVGDVMGHPALTAGVEELVQAALQKHMKPPTSAMQLVPLQQHTYAKGEAMSGAIKRARGVSRQEAAGTADGDTAAVLKACHRTAVQELIVEMVNSGDNEKAMIMFHNAVAWVNKTAEGLFYASKLKEGSPYVNIPKGRIISYYIELIKKFPTHKDALEGIRKTVEMRATIHQPGPGLEDFETAVKHGVKEYGQSLVHNPAFINQVTGEVMGHPALTAGVAELVQAALLKHMKPPTSAMQLVPLQQHNNTGSDEARDQPSGTVQDDPHLPKMRKRSRWT